MSFTTVLYESDGVIRFAPRVRAAVKTQCKTQGNIQGKTQGKTPDKTPGQGTKTQRVAQHAHSLGKRRTRRGAIEVLIGAIWNALRSVGLWIEEKSTQAHYRRVESYLAQSSNHADLERRLCDIERGSRLNWIDGGSR